MKSIIKCIACVFMAAGVAGASAQAGYPDRPVQLVVGFPAG